MSTGEQQRWTAPAVGLPAGVRTETEVASDKLYGSDANVLGVRVNALDMERTLARIKEALVARAKGYVCMAGVHGIMEAQRNPGVGCAYAGAMMTLPDGRPTVWVGRWQGHDGMRQVTGPDLMLEVFRRKEFAEYSHFLYGGKPGIAEELAEKLTEPISVGAHRRHIYAAVPGPVDRRSRRFDQKDSVSQAGHHLGRHQHTEAGAFHAELPAVAGDDAHVRSGSGFRFSHGPDQGLF